MGPQPAEVSEAPRKWMQMCPAALGAQWVLNASGWMSLEKAPAKGLWLLFCCLLQYLPLAPCPPLPSIQPLQVDEDCPAPTRALGWSPKKIKRDEYFMALD